MRGELRNHGLKATEAKCSIFIWLTISEKTTTKPIEQRELKPPCTSMKNNITNPRV